MSKYVAPCLCIFDTCEYCEGEQLNMSKLCKLKCGKPAMENARFSDMCFEHYLEHNRAIDKLNNQARARNRIRARKGEI